MYFMKNGVGGQIFIALSRALSGLGLYMGFLVFMLWCYAIGDTF